MSPTRRPPIARRGQRGAASLLVVMVLFFVMALAAAYASRNLIFEQRISANNYRATQALEAAEAGLDWAVGMLARGRVTDSCVPTTDPAASTFRSRFLAQDGDGRFVFPPGLADLRASCTLLAGGWSCSCPGSGLPTLSASSTPAPTFQVRFVPDAALTAPGVVRIESRGCNLAGSPCYPAGAQRADAEALVTMVLGSASALANPPTTALTVRGQLDLLNSPVTVVNTDTATAGITLVSGGGLLNDGALVARSAAGAVGSRSVLPVDSALAAMDATRLFVSAFGIPRETYATQPAVLPVQCAGDCAATLRNAASAHPGRPLWVQGDAVIDSDLSLGSATTPVLLVVDGNLTIHAAFDLAGMVYLRGTQLTVDGSMQVRGATVAEGNLAIQGGVALVYDRDALRRISLYQGSLVRVPGSWRDFTPN